MKKYLLLFLFAFISIQILFAQSYTNTQDSIFKNLDKSKINTGVLYDRVYPCAQLSEIAHEMPYTFAFVRQAWFE